MSGPNDQSNVGPVEPSKDSPYSHTVSKEFMLEEYKNISRAHFELHNGLRQTFRFYLGLVAIPITLFAFIYKDAKITLESLPSALAYTICLIGFIGFLMFLSLISIRFDIIFYTRAVNGTRRYFMDMSERLALEPLNQYLLLPGDINFPPFRETFKGAYWWQFALVTLINSLYLALGLSNRLAIEFFAINAIKFIIGSLVIHWVLYYVFARKRDRDVTDRLIEMGLTL